MIPLTNDKSGSCKLNSPINPRETEAGLKSHPNETKISGQDGFCTDFYQIVKEQLIPTLPRLLHAKEKEQGQVHSMRTLSP